MREGARPMRCFRRGERETPLRVMEKGVVCFEGTAGVLCCSFCCRVLHHTLCGMWNGISNPDEAYTGS